MAPTITPSPSVGIGRSGALFLALCVACVDHAAAFSAPTFGLRVGMRRPSASPSSVVKLRASAGFISTNEDKAKAYEAVTTAWSFSALTNVLSPPKALPVVVSTLSTESVRALWVLPVASYLLVLLVLRSLHHAAEKDLLKSPTYRRLNLSFAAESAVMLGLTVAGWMAYAPKTGIAATPRLLSMLASVLGVVVGMRVWQQSITEGSAGVRAMAAEAAAGLADSVKKLFTPSTIEGTLYRVLCLALLGQAAVNLIAPQYALVTLFGRAMADGIGAVRAWGAMLLFQAVCAFTLGDAADRKRLGGTTFRDINIGFTLTFAVQAGLLYVAQGKSGVFIELANILVLVAYMGISAFFSVFCLVQNLAPLKATDEPKVEVTPKMAEAQVEAQEKALDMQLMQVADAETEEDRGGASSVIEAFHAAESSQEEEAADGEGAGGGAEEQESAEDFKQALIEKKGAAQKKALEMQLKQSQEAAEKRRVEEEEAGRHRGEMLEKKRARQAKALEIQLQQVEEGKRQKANAGKLSAAEKCLSEAFEEIEKGDLDKAKELWMQAEAAIAEVGDYADAESRYKVRNVQKALRIAIWKEDAEATSEMSDEDWAKKKQERASSQGESGRILQSLEDMEETADERSNAKDVASEAFEQAEDQIAAGDWAGAEASLAVAEANWEAAGLMGLDGAPFEAAIEGLRAKIPSEGGREEEPPAPAPPPTPPPAPEALPPPPAAPQGSAGGGDEGAGGTVSSSFADRLETIARNRVGSLTQRMLDVEAGGGGGAAAPQDAQLEDVGVIKRKDSGQDESSEDFGAYLDELRSKRQDRLTRKIDELSE